MFNDHEKTTLKSQKAEKSKNFNYIITKRKERSLSWSVLSRNLVKHLNIKGMCSKIQEKNHMAKVKYTRDG